jgi:hypothetical protein
MIKMHGERVRIVPIYLQFLPRREQSVTVGTTRQLMLFREVIGV